MIYMIYMIYKTACAVGMTFPLPQCERGVLGDGRLLLKPRLSLAGKTRARRGHQHPSHMRDCGLAPVMRPNSYRRRGEGEAKIPCRRKRILMPASCEAGNTAYDGYCADLQMYIQKKIRRGRDGQRHPAVPMMRLIPAILSPLG